MTSNMFTMIGSNLDFTTSHGPSIEEFASKLCFMTLAWILILSSVKYICRALASQFWSHSVPIYSASIPSKIPHPNPPGSAVPFDVPLKKATDEQIKSFMSFICKSDRKSANSPSEKWSREEVLQSVADCAAAYKGKLYEERAMKWIDDHFRLKLPKLKYPYVDRHWNGWSSFWIETGPHIRSMFIASMAVTAEHVVNGFVLPLLYLRTKNVLYYNLCLYGEVGFMVYTSILILSSMVLGRDLTIEQMHPAVWSLLLVHHISSMVLCVGCLFMGGSVPKELVCYVLLALLGLTSSLHYVGQMLDFSPLSFANTPYLRLLNHVFCLASQVFFRGIYWMKLLYVSMMHSYEAHGLGVSITVALIFLLFTAFNADFVKFHLKATKGAWIRMQDLKKTA